jgi:excisionase family DNA binding protein
MYLTIPETAERFGVKLKFVYDLINAKVLPSIKLQLPNKSRPVLRVPIAALEKWEADQIKASGE